MTKNTHDVWQSKTLIYVKTQNTGVRRGGGPVGRDARGRVEDARTHPERQERLWQLC